MHHFIRSVLVADEKVLFVKEDDLLIYILI